MKATDNPWKDMKIGLAKLKLSMSKRDDSESTLEGELSQEGFRSGHIILIRIQQQPEYRKGM